MTHNYTPLARTAPSQPIFTTLLRDPSAVALIIFPTKALLRDQLRSLHDMIAESSALSTAVRASALDGDTAASVRSDIAANSNIMLCNPDILHATVLPGHAGQWGRLIRSTHHIVIDEAHVYCGIFGTHVSLVLRRLLRLIAHHGRCPQIFAASATISNPLDHFHALLPVSIGADSGARFAAEAIVTSPLPTRPYDSALHYSRAVVLIDIDGAGIGFRRLMIWNPPLISGNVIASVSDNAETAVHKRAEGATKCADYKLAVHEESSYCTEPMIPTVKRQRRGRVARVTNLATDVPDPRQDDERATSSESRMEPRAHSPNSNDFLVVTKSEEQVTLDRVHPPATVACSSTLSLTQQSLHPQTRRNALIEAAIIIDALTRLGMRTLAFVRSRKSAELLLQMTHERIVSQATSAQLTTDRLSRITAYRAGYMQERRRGIEAALSRGDLLCVIATNALELGVDIGCLDVIVIVGWPGTVSSFWQQAGRSGRGARDSAVILVCFDSPTDQWIARTSLTSLAPEAAVLTIVNDVVMGQHALCAAAELPLTPGDVS